MVAPGASHAPAPTGTTTNISSGASTSAIQTAITAASAGTTLIFPAESFNITTTLNLKTGVSLYGLPGATLVAAYASSSNGMHASGVSNVTISGFICDGGTDGGGGTLNGFIFVDNECSNIHVQWNTFQNNFNQSDLFMYNSDSIYFQKNVCGPNEFQPVSMHRTEGTTHSNIFVTDNTITEYARMAIEALFNVQGEYHIDRNTISGQDVPNASGGGIALSIVNDNGEGGGGSNQHGTIWGNSISGDTVGIEIVLTNMTIKNNTIVTSTGFFIGTCAGSVIENNMITSGNVFQEDGGYDGTEWVGTNTINGVSSAGWSGHGPYGTKPAVYTPSAEPGGSGGPQVSSLTPGSTTDLGGGTSVVIAGTTFTDATAVTFGGVDASSFTVDGDTQITAVAPAHAAGTVQVVVT